MDDLGTLKPKTVADLFIFEMGEGEFVFTDSDQNDLNGNMKLLPVATIKDGKLWWKRDQK